MLANIKPGKPARIPGAVTTPYVLELIEAKRRDAPLEPLMSRIMRELGFDSFMYGMSANAAPNSRDGRAFVWTTLPLRWVRRYGEKGYIEIDPRVSETYNRNVPLVWDAADYADDARYEEFFRDAAGFGIRSGVAISFRDPDHGRIVCAFNSNVSPVTAERRAMIAQRLGELMLFATSFHDFFMAHFVDSQESLMVRVAPLSKRERQCLELAANGMTSKDIGSKLGITERTSNYHFGNLIQKLGVLNRKEAIAVAITRGWVRVQNASLRSGNKPVRRRYGSAK
jgi:LuxR family transcriptional regulator, quorum-sensing system regulator LasR